MRLARFGDNRLALVEGYVLRDITQVTERLPQYRWPLPVGDQFIANLDAMRRAIKGASEAATRIPVTDVKLLSPIANPPRVIAADRPGFALRAPTGVLGAGEGDTLNLPDARTAFEMSLAVVVGEKADSVSAKEALDIVAGYCIGLSFGVADEHGLVRSPNIQTVLGPWLVTADEISDPQDLRLRIAVDGHMHHEGSTKHLAAGVLQMVAHASRVFTIYPGDVLLSGIPEAAGVLASGATIRATIDGIGAMDVKVR
jgi:2-keto-4-pentenoate hydratase/2-oxohepta-3-ene-1,7-dioic acid hydratase in catechol pathway